MRSLKILLVGVAAISLAMVAPAGEPPMAKPNDRTGLFDANTVTSNDLRRVPVASGTNAPKGAIVIRNARLFDGTGAAARDAVLIIEGDRVTSILPARSTEVRKGAEIIDAGGRTVMPGLIDLHTHLTYVHAFGLPGPVSEESQAAAAIRGAERLRY